MIEKTERNPNRDPVDPWRDWAYRAAAKCAKPNDEVVIDEVRDVDQLQGTKKLRPNTRELVIIGHADRNKLAIGSGDVSRTNISSLNGPNDVAPNRIDWSPVRQGGKIHVWACNAAESPTNTSIAKQIANASRRQVEAYSNYVTLGPDGPVTSGWTATFEGIRRGFDFGGRVDLSPDPLGSERW